MIRCFVLGLLVLALVACGGPATPTPDTVATQVAFEQSVAATLTAGAPTATAAPTGTSAPTATAAPTGTAAPTTGPTETRPVPPTVPGGTEVEPEPPVGPVVGDYAVVGVASDDVLNVRAGPGVSRAIVGTIPYNGLYVEVHAGDQQVDGSWWVPVVFRDVSGWVNSHYLARQVGWLDETVAARAAQMIVALKDRDLQALSGLVHSAKGLRFSPYTFVRVVPDPRGDLDLVFPATEIPGLASDPTIYHWGTMEGSGDPIDLTFAQYYDEFIYDADFAHPDVVGFNQAIGHSSMINNIAEVYPGAVAIEYHFEGFEQQYAGYDWLSLRLVLEQAGDTWVLVGIVHDEWTP
jgi:hypothetical protein